MGREERVFNGPRGKWERRDEKGRRNVPASYDDFLTHTQGGSGVWK